jgi:hypothetical protein
MFGPRLSLSLSGVSLISLISFKLLLMIEQTWLKGSGCLPRANTTSVNVRMWPVPVTSSPPKAWSKVMMGIWPPTAASYRNCDPPNFPCPGCAEKILKLCRTYQDVQVWGSSHMVWSTGLGPTDNDASPSNSLTVSFIYIYYIIICILYQSIEGKCRLII